MDLFTSLNRREVLLYLGYRGGDIPPEITAQLERCISLAAGAADPRTVWREFDLLEEEGALSAGGLILEGQEIRRHLAGCNRVILFAATLGSRAESLIRRAEVKNMADALILDAVFSAAVEALCDRWQEEREAQYREAGLFLTDRFSPGYGDLPIECQKSFARVLDTGRRIGLTVSETSLLIPRKSVTALLGISAEEKPRRSRGCAVCSIFEKCPYRKEGNYCGQSA